MDNGDSVLSEVNPDFDADPGYELRSWRFVLQSGNRYEIPLWRPGEGPEAGEWVRDGLPEEARKAVADFHREHFSSMREQLAKAYFHLDGLGLIPGNPLPRVNEHASGHDPEIPEYVEDGPIAFFAELFDVEGNDADAMYHRYKTECLLELMNRLVSDFANRVSYLGPLRWMPPRVVSLSGETDTASGEFAWSQLMKEPGLLEKVNRHLAGSIRADFRLECRRLSPLPSTDEVDRIVRDAMAASSEPEEPEARVAEEPDHDALQARLAQELTERLQSKTGDPVFELTIVDNTTGLAVSHRDVGTGISQLLPVLVHAASQKEQLIMIEQPELHLHPKLQADLGDVFRDSALGENKNTFLIETHSEHLILRLLRRIRETTGGQHGDAPPVRPDDVALLYVEPREEGAVVHRLRVDEHGRLIDPCPGGFFEEDFDEVF